MLPFGKLKQEEEMNTRLATETGKTWKGRSWAWTIPTLEAESEAKAGRSLQIETSLVRTIESSRATY